MYISPQAMMSVIGTEMDYVDDKLRSEFIFHNPNATGTCGCGESFNIDWLDQDDDKLANLFKKNS